MFTYSQCVTLSSAACSTSRHWPLVAQKEWHSSPTLFIPAESEVAMLCLPWHVTYESQFYRKENWKCFFSVFELFGLKKCTAPECNVGRVWIHYLFGQRWSLRSKTFIIGSYHFDTTYLHCLFPHVSSVICVGWWTMLSYQLCFITSLRGQEVSSGISAGKHDDCCWI